jgi:hypothetical protein
VLQIRLKGTYVLRYTCASNQAKGTDFSRYVRVSFALPLIYFLSKTKTTRTITAQSPPHHDTSGGPRVLRSGIRNIKGYKKINKQKPNIRHV